MNKAILDELMQLSPAERLDIAEKLWESVDPNDPNIVDDIAPLSEEQMQEVRRRIAEHERNPGSAIPWEEVRARLWARVIKPSRGIFVEQRCGIFPTRSSIS